MRQQLAIYVAAHGAASEALMVCLQFPVVLFAGEDMFGAVSPGS
jgi:hypothetical protein